jgi:metal-responsive CopG/Arc/MetJ family transcriptional regulator
MKTAISVPDPVFASADALARRLGISRSQLYATALAEYVAKFQATKVTERLDAVYAKEGSRIEPRLARAQRRALQRAEW